MNDFHTYEQYLDKEGFFLTHTFGNSMEPLLHDKKNVVLIKKSSDTLKKYDIVLYKRRGQYVLHRILEINDGKYVICGDNCINKEIVPFENVIGYAEGYYKGEKYIVFDKSIMYKIYVHIWCDFFAVRHIIIKIRFKLIKTIWRDL